MNKFLPFSGETITFWAGPRIDTGNEESMMFPNANGFALKAEQFIPKKPLAAGLSEKKVVKK